MIPDAQVAGTARRFIGKTMKMPREGEGPSANEKPRMFPAGWR
jgi:hypothetical protein